MSITLKMHERRDQISVLCLLHSPGRDKRDLAPQQVQQGVCGYHHFDGFAKHFK